MVPENDPSENDSDDSNPTRGTTAPPVRAFVTETAPETLLLLSTFNGARYLPEQLASLLAQSHPNWRLLWRDDGSTDSTVALLDRFAAGQPPGRSAALAGSGRHLGAAASFMALLHAAAGQGCARVALVDQDDVWLPEKLARGVAALDAVPAGRPALYCARQMLVDAGLRHLGLSAPPAPRPGFPAALTQNIAAGCTIMLNRPALALIGRSTPSPATLHDWWCYLLVAAAGGEIIQDAEPVLLYRQHAANLVGAPHSRARRGLAALRRGPGVFMNVLRHNVAALAAHPELLTAEARADLARIDAALGAGRLARLAALGLPGLRRQNWLETLLFRLWFVTG